MQVKGTYQDSDNDKVYVVDVDVMNISQLIMELNKTWSGKILLSNICTDEGIAYNQGCYWGADIHDHMALDRYLKES